MTTKTEVRERLTPAEAQAKGLIPLGHVWDEGTQQPIARGVALEEAQLDRPLDLTHQLDDWKRNRDRLLAFVRDYLEEASYDAKGYPIQGQVRDFYKVPGGGETKALTKRGAEKLATLFRFGKATTDIVARTETAEYVSATVQVTLADQYRRSIGSAVSSCSTAEPGFRSVFAQKKYGAEIVKEQGEWLVKKPGDFRAALNDVVARASKRAFVQALIVATAADEIFTAAEEAETTPLDSEETKAPAAATPQPPTPSKATGTVMPFGKTKGTPLADHKSDELLAVKLWCEKSNPKKFAALMRAIDDTLASRQGA